MAASAVGGIKAATGDLDRSSGIAATRRSSAVVPAS
jgi:hypothetical protein